MCEYLCCGLACPEKDTAMSCLESYLTLPKIIGRYSAHPPGSHDSES